MTKRKGREMKTVRRWVLILSGLLITVTSIVLIFEPSGFSGTSEPDQVDPEDKSNYAIYAIQIPDTLFFAGEEVPVNHFDVREALDRELISNMYFHSQTIRYIKLANRFFPQIVPILQEHGIPDDFKYLAIAESGLENVVSPAGAVGFWQITKATGIEYGLEVNEEVDERYHVEKSTKAACKYLNESYGRYGNWTMAAASYNAGRKGIDRQVSRQKQENYYDLLLNDETSRYIFRILAFKLILENPSEYGFRLSNKDLYNPVAYKIVEVSGPVPDFADFAAEHGTNYKLLKFLNPWLRDNILTNSRGKTYEIKIPLER